VSLCLNSSVHLSVRLSMISVSTHTSFGSCDRWQARLGAVHAAAQDRTADAQRVRLRDLSGAHAAGCDPAGRPDCVRPAYSCCGVCYVGLLQSHHSPRTRRRKSLTQLQVCVTRSLRLTCSLELSGRSDVRWRWSRGGWTQHC
jgi:hypothetical protein